MDIINPGDLLVNDFPIQTVPVTIASGADLLRGAILGRITASGKYALSAVGAGDGSETPSLVLAVNAAAGAADVDASAYASAAVDGSKLTFGTSHTAATAEAAFRAAAAPLYVKTLA